MGGRNSFTLADYADLSDRQILALLQIEWDEQGSLVTEADQARQGSLRSAARELPSPEQLGLSEEQFQEAYAINPRCGTAYLVMFFSVWSRRGKSIEETMELWRDHVGR